jgi:hypothetical protein
MLAEVIDAKPWRYVPGLWEFCRPFVYGAAAWGVCYVMARLAVRSYAKDNPAFERKLKEPPRELTDEPEWDATAGRLAESVRRQADNEGEEWKSR